MHRTQDGSYTPGLPRYASPWRPLVVWTLVLFASWFGPHVHAAQESGEAVQMTLETENGPVSLSFCYCPAGSLRPGAPKVPAAQAIDVRSFYLQETEVTIDAFSRVLEKDRMEKIRERAGENLRDLLDDAKMPIFLVDFADISDFCQGLEQLIQQQPTGDFSRLETRQFRLPTHHEWQYACRAREDAEQGDQFSHFYAWPRNFRVLDKIIQNKCEEEWKEMGRKDAFVGSQEQVLAILKTRNKPNNPKPLEILGAFLEAGIGVKRDYATTPDPLPLRTPRASRANAWGIFDMHNNVREWTLAGAAQQKPDELWQELTTDPQDGPSLSRRGLFFLAGGSFVDNAFGSHGYMRFTIWGGFTQSIEGQDVGLVPQTGEIVAFSLRDVEDSDLLYDQVPGFRVIMQRVLRRDWRLLVRNDVVLADKVSEDTLAAFAGHRKTVTELLSASQQSDAQAFVDFYAALASYRLGKRDDCNNLLQDERLASIRQSDPYFETLAELVAIDAGAE